MLKQKMILLMLLTVIGTSCNTIELRQHILKLKVERDPINNRLYIDEEYSGCFTRWFRYSSEFIGPIENLMEVPIDNCDKLFGHRNLDYNEAIKALNSSRLDYNRLKNRNAY